jgi:hypothetical protein
MLHSINRRHVLPMIKKTGLHVAYDEKNSCALPHFTHKRVGANATFSTPSRRVACEELLMRRRYTFHHHYVLPQSKSLALALARIRI